MNDLTVDLSIPFPSEREADVAYQTLRVDVEPSRSGVKKTLKLESNVLKVNFTGTEARKVRVGLTAFFDSLLLIGEAMREFGPPQGIPNKMSESTPAPYLPRSGYGYALYIGSNLLLLLYFVWAFVPDEVLNDKLGLFYWPMKHWAVALPIWVLTGIAFFAFAIYPAINMLLTPDIDDIRTITDEHSLQQHQSIPGGIPPVSDIPITEVCRKLYLQKD